MAIASYTTDLTTIATGDLILDAGTWDESTDGGWDTGGSMVDDENLYYNNTECVSAQLTKDSNGSGASGPATIFYNHTATFTIPADGAALIHHMWAAPPALNTLNNATSAGINICAGSSLGDFYAWKASGSDFAPAPRGGWANYAINPAIGTPDHTVGTAPTVYSMIGIGVSATAQARGNPNACNAVRYGRCESIFTDGDLANGYATFHGYSLIDDAITNKWNLIEPVEGGYKFQGLMSLGTATTAVDFREANVTMNIRNTINVTAPFNAIEVNHASSNIEWTAISISALGTVSRGTFEMIDNATVSKASCTFTDMNTFVYQSGATIENSIYRRCGLITQGSSTITGCTIDNPSGTVGLLVNSLNSVTKTTFNSDGTGHGVDLGTVSADISLNWDNFESGYTASSSGNETILVSVDSGITLTINVLTGASTPSVYNTGLGTVNVVSGQVTTTITVKDIATGAVLDGARVYLIGSGGDLDGVVIFNILTNVNGQVSDTRSISANQSVVGRVRHSTTPNFYKTVPISETIDSANGLNLNVAMIKDI
ncbi:MAG: hypothetical protein U9O83_01120 [Campylobacterota bacterium]|nr:hypothetical protein [Campylobacterota bacterium]